MVHNPAAFDITLKEHYLVHKFRSHVIDTQVQVQDMKRIAGSGDSTE